MKYKIRYTEKDKQNSYMNACDCLYYGYGYSYFIPCGNYSEEIKKAYGTRQKMTYVKATKQ